MEDTKKAPPPLHEGHLKIILGLKSPKVHNNAYKYKNKYGGDSEIKFSYRSCSDILERVKPFLEETGLRVYLKDKLIFQSDTRAYIEATAILTNGVEQVEATALAKHPESRASTDDSQLTGSASSYARKYALSALFAIDDTKDADTPEYTAQRLADAAGTQSTQPARSQVPVSQVAKPQVSSTQVSTTQVSKPQSFVKTKPMATVKKTYSADAYKLPTPSNPDNDGLPSDDGLPF